MLKIGIIKETKTPIDNRVVLTPRQIIEIERIYKNVKFYVQKSNVRCYHDEEYFSLGIPVIEDVGKCDILLGIKEPDINTLIPYKHYIFFGHIAKKQPYNQILAQSLVKNKITFSDYELLTDFQQKRLLSFGWFAGVVGVYNTIRLYGLKSNRFKLEPPGIDFSLDKLKNNLYSVKHLCDTSVIITGNGMVSHGAQFVMKHMGAFFMDKDMFVNSTKNGFTYTVLKSEDLVVHKYGKDFVSNDFKIHGEDYVSNFKTYAHSAEILVSCHSWNNNQPIYIDEDILKDNNRTIKIIGDITCDIKGSILSTIRASTHDKPFYDFNPITMDEEPVFSNENNICVMAVDTCPNALANEASESFGNQFLTNILPRLLKDGINDTVINNGTILINGELNKNYLYLKDYVRL
jgi:alanine dehydrogenase